MVAGDGKLGAEKGGLRDQDREGVRRMRRGVEIGSKAAGLLLAMATAGAIQAQEHPREHAVIAWEAEDFTAMLPPVEAQTFQGASGGKCVTVPDGVRSFSGGLRYVVRIPQTDTYYPWYRVYRAHGWDGWGQLRVDGEPAGGIVGVGSIPLDRWHWMRGLPRRTRSELETHPSVALTQGLHTLSLGAPGICMDGMAVVYGKLDMILLTTDPDYVPGGDGEAPVVPSEGVVLRQEPPEVLLVWEADDRAPGQDWAGVVEIDGAHGGKALRYADEPEHPVTLRLRIPKDGTYYLWARILGPGTVRATLGSEGIRMALRVASDSRREWWPWVWARDSKPIHAAREITIEPRAIALTAGQTEFVVTWARTAVDQFALTNDPNWVPGGDGRQPLEVTTHPF